MAKAKKWERKCIFTQRYQIFQEARFVFTRVKKAKIDRPIGVSNIYKVEQKKKPTKGPSEFTFLAETPYGNEPQKFTHASTARSPDGP